MRTRTPVALAVLGLLAAAASAQSSRDVRMDSFLNDTGLTRCTLDFRTFTSACTGTGQDAETGRDARQDHDRDGQAGFSFAKVCNSGEAAGTGSCSTDAQPGSGPDDWGCTRDRVTGLLWEIKNRDGGLHDADARYTNWGDGRPGDASAFVAAVNAAGLCGATDWRLPDTHELQGIEDFNFAKPHPSIDVSAFPHSFASVYWASEPYLGQEDTVAWGVSFIMDPHNISVTGGLRGKLQPVRLVQAPAPAAPAAAKPRFTFAADEVADGNSHLVWKRCSEGQSWDGTTCTGTARQFRFPKAFSWAQQRAAATGKAWRVPNAKELHSLVDHARMNPSIDETVFPGTVPGLYWTSTAYAWTATGAWAVNFSMGHVLAYENSYLFPLRLVRNGD